MTLCWLELIQIIMTLCWLELIQITELTLN